MSKRSYADFTSKDTALVSQILEHAEDLLKAAKDLKKELETFRDTTEPNDKIISVLKSHNKKILPATQLLAQDEVNMEPQINITFDADYYCRRLSWVNRKISPTRSQSLEMIAGNFGTHLRHFSYLPQSL